jgi:hypothetical protein
MSHQTIFTYQGELVERPTCKTCPYWSIEDDDGNPITFEQCLKLPGDNIDPDLWYFECKRYPCADEEAILKHGFDWCGEHADFSAYIASLKLN